MTRNRFEFIDDILCGVEATPERVTIARSLLEEEFKKSENTIRISRRYYNLMVDTLETVSRLMAWAGLAFAKDDKEDGHTQLKLAIELNDKMTEVLKKRG